MKKELDLVKEFHEKFGALMSDAPSLISEDRAKNRFKLMQEEVEEYAEGTQKGDLPNIAKELADILYTVYGTILEHGLQDTMPKVFEEVHQSNMSKTAHEYKMVKGPGYKEANVDQFFETRKGTVQQYFESWIAKDDTFMKEHFADDIVYSECYGPEYKEKQQCLQWFKDWNEKGSVLEWRIKSYYEIQNSCVVEWYFKCDYEGKVDGFDGVSIIEWTGDKISSIKEFQSKAEHHCPYTT